MRLVSRFFLYLVDAIEPIRRPRGRARKPPQKLHAEKAYDAKKCPEALRRGGIKTRIARKGKESSEKLGRHRWVVEGTLSWLNRCRGLKVRYERRADIHQAFPRSRVCLDLLELVQRFC